MSLKDRLVERGKKLASSDTVVRIISNDRVMRVATGVMDARSRMRAAADLAAEAWSVLLNGHELPTIDPALEGGADVVQSRAKKTNGSHAAEAPAVSTDAPAASPK